MQRDQAKVQNQSILPKVPERFSCQDHFSKKYIGFSLTINFQLLIIIINIFSNKYNILGVAKCERGGWGGRLQGWRTLDSFRFLQGNCWYSKYTSNAEGWKRGENRDRSQWKIRLTSCKEGESDRLFYGLEKREEGRSKVIWSIEAQWGEKDQRDGTPTGGFGNTVPLSIEGQRFRSDFGEICIVY